MLTRTICNELAPYGITVNNIAPGAIFTPIDADVEADPEEVGSAVCRNSPASHGATGRDWETGGLPGFRRSSIRDWLNLRDGRWLIGLCRSALAHCRRRTSPWLQHMM